jgi:hypothetical protein
MAAEFPAGEAEDENLGDRAYHGPAAPGGNRRKESPHRARRGCRAVFPTKLVF